MVGERKMAEKALAWRVVFLICCIFATCRSEIPSSYNQDHVPKASNDLNPNSSLNTASEHESKEPVVRNRRGLNSEDRKKYIQDGNRVLRSVYQYNDQIMRNLLQDQSPKPINFARSHFFLNLLKPLDRRTSRYNSWDDHSVMHFGKRSVPLEVTDEEKLL
ncbi:uncharacterized protein CEXT_471201 [Caerostris extrusa]|uniref:Uncharacterized protein n=1 Tax=Caerostris extrusa TaxID=172846 RepID=A0AAV4YDG7_CAEEX|nr:uncharacterized protein CEXT_471201 [Caerostris extrusa]